MNSTPSTLALTMCATALPPPPPTPMTLMTAFGAIFSTSSNMCHAPCPRCVMMLSIDRVAARFPSVLHRLHASAPSRRTADVAQNSPRYQFLNFVQQRCPPCRSAAPDARGCSDLAAQQQQAHAGGVHRIADHFAQTGDVLRNADAHRHVQHFLGQLDHAFHLRGAAGQHHAGARPVPRSRSGAVRPAPSRRFPRSASAPPRPATGAPGGAAGGRRRWAPGCVSSARGQLRQRAGVARP